MTSPAPRSHEAIQFTLASWVMRCGMYLSLVVFFSAAVLRIAGGGWEGPYLPASALLDPAAWGAPGDALLWVGVMILGLTPLTALFMILVFSFFYRRMFDVVLSCLIFLLFAVSIYLGV